MTTTQMECFISVYNCKSFTKAAEALYITQPAISKNIATLEEELGVKLIERKKGGKIQFTESGKAYYLTFDSILKNLEDTDFRVKYILPNKKRVFRVGMMETWYVPDFIRMCNNELPNELNNIEFIFELNSPKTINGLIEDGKLDFVFTIDPAYTHNKNYTKEHVVNIHSSIYVSSQNPAVENGLIHLDKLEPVLYLISERQLTHINILQIHELFYPRKPIIREILSGHSAFMNVISGYGAAISDSWSLNHFSPLTVSFIQKNMIVPVIFARRNTNDSYFTLVSDYILAEFRKWIELKDGN